jgi:hypothetical protein
MLNKILLQYVKRMKVHSLMLVLGYQNIFLDSPY